MILVIDNYDSFVYNVARYLDGLGAETTVVRNDAASVADIRELRPDGIVISPGPCTPNEAGVSCAVLEEFSGLIPILGVCLGHQCMGAVFGGRVKQARRPLHGQASTICHSGKRLFAGLPEAIEVGRYHSLIVEATSDLLDTMTIDAWSPEDEIMALSHKMHPTFGIQFHPESVLTPSGRAIFRNFLSLARLPISHAVV